jgi:hypothetical protein
VSRSASVRRVPIRRLDTLCADGAFARADFIKIDCEGFEPEILKGAQALLCSGVLAVEIETNFNTSEVPPQIKAAAQIRRSGPGRDSASAAE